MIVRRGHTTHQHRAARGPRPGSGNDTLAGGRGNDLLTRSDGKDIIADFSHKQGDRIDLSDLAAITSYKELVATHMREQDGDLLVTIYEASSILHENVKREQLRGDDFMF